MLAAGPLHREPASPKPLSQATGGPPVAMMRRAVRCALRTARAKYTAVGYSVGDCEPHRVDILPRSAQYLQNRRTSRITLLSQPVGVDRPIVAVVGAWDDHRNTSATSC